MVELADLLGLWEAKPYTAEDHLVGHGEMAGWDEAKMRRLAGRFIDENDLTEQFCDWLDARWREEGSVNVYAEDEP
jgi:hypothetical protein